MNADTALIQEGLSDKVGLILQFSAAFVSGFVIGFVKGWKLALVLCCVFPVLAGAAVVLSKILAGGSTEEQAAYASAGGVAQQVLSSMRTVVAFGGEARESDRYNKHLDEAERFGIRKALFNGMGVGFIQGVIFLVYALAFYYGNTLIPNDMNGGQVLNVFFAIIIGAFSLGNATPHLSAIGTAQGAAFKIFETIDRVSPIDPLSANGAKPQKVDGNIEFKNIDFHYPSRTDVPILKNFNLTVSSGQTVALVGASGSGKSTIVKLVERFYDPVNGIVTLDGQNVKDLNVAWLRQQIGIVSQEPTLFDTSIRQNILYGLRDDGEGLDKAKLDEMVKNACVMANAWEFISKLPNGVDTNVGEAGSMLSGGQKQRIAIARAIIKDPRILLLDEATSALDTESERIVQAALERASQNRTTIVIAHRLSTVKNADQIVVMSQGVVVETGTHESLIADRGYYYELVEAQRLKSRDGGDESNSETLPSEPEDAESVAAVDAAKAASSAGKSQERDFVVVEVTKSANSLARDSKAKAKKAADAAAAEEEKKKLANDRKVDVGRIMMLNRPSGSALSWAESVLLPTVLSCLCSRSCSRPSSPRSVPTAPTSGRSCLSPSRPLPRSPTFCRLVSSVTQARSSRAACAPSRSALFSARRLPFSISRRTRPVHSRPSSPRTPVLCRASRA
ncbi:P-loop containing nucleoside triphosphate hydrolase protein [Entophlyctis helioformis]|nr:P-loop containing nucleoside triphosphate hydrolase protein [Entophlyctis helioformis]